jgi:UDP-N-acetylmuramate dehydrogenase
MTPQADVALAPFCTMGVGGPARWLVSARSESEIVQALAWAGERNVSVTVLGGGSNVLIADEGIAGLVIHVDVRGVDPKTSNGRVSYAVGAGEPWDPVVAESVAADCAGLECLSGIPGSAGGTPVQNVGAYGQDVSETIARVRVIDRQTIRTLYLSNAECAFGYRSSRFKREDLNRYIVTWVEFGLAANGRPKVAYADIISFLQSAGNNTPTLLDVREAVLTIRRRKGMVIEPGNAANQSCGSFFVNPVVTVADLQRVRDLSGVPDVPHYVVDAATVKIPAAWLIERAGFPKGTVRGAVGISPFQAQAIINRGRARAKDVLMLASEVKRGVWNMFGISIVPEPVFVGFAPSPELHHLLTHQRSH